MGCDSQFDDLYEGRRQREAELKARGYSTPVRGSLYSGPYQHTGCGAIVGNMDAHDRVCELSIVNAGKSDYMPRHRR